MVSITDVADYRTHILLLASYVVTLPNGEEIYSETPRTSQSSPVDTNFAQDVWTSTVITVTRETARAPVILLYLDKFLKTNPSLLNISNFYAF